MRILRRLALGLGLILPAFPVLAENLALVLTRDAGFLHSELTAGYAEAGFTVLGGFDLDGPATTSILTRFEGLAPEADHLVIHLTGGLRDAGGLAVYVPTGLSDDSLTGLLTGGIPLPLFLGIAAAQPGRSVLALGGYPETADAPAPDGVLVVTGPAEQVGTVVLTRLLSDGLAPAEVDTTAYGVRFSGLVSTGFRLGQAGTSGAVQDSDPATAEAALALDAAAIMALQASLSTLGYFDGVEDGALGPATRFALSEWQADNGFAATGYLAPESHARLLDLAGETHQNQSADAAERKDWDAARKRDSIESLSEYLRTYPDGRFVARARDRLETLENAAEQAERVARYRAEEQALGLTLASMATIEKRLRRLGLSPGLADGRIEIDTRRAIAQFQAQVGLTPTGYLSSATLQRLVISGG